MGLRSTIKFIASHPLNTNRIDKGIGSFLYWQAISRFKEEHHFNWISGQKLIVKKGMTGATGNIYCGLHEASEMAFFLNSIKEGELFLDIGANIGSYSIIASGCCKAKSIAFEASSATVEHILKNIEINSLGEKVNVLNIALGDYNGEIKFSTGLDTVNHVIEDESSSHEVVEIRRLDDIDIAQEANFIKMDVEGFEEKVISGANNVLSSEKVLAVQTELVSSEVNSFFINNGFVRIFYEPITRKIYNKPINNITMSNAIYVRDIDDIKKRVESAPRIYCRGLYL